jgi:hypothetical protein
MPEDDEQRECPLCGGVMRLRQGEIITRVPGDPAPATRPQREWVCPDCDNFEEADE